MISDIQLMGLVTIDGVCCNYTSYVKGLLINIINKPEALLHSDAKPNMQQTSMNNLVGLNCLSMPYSLAERNKNQGRMGR